jgi:hypothetical protein
MKRVDAPSFFSDGLMQELSRYSDDDIDNFMKTRLNQQRQEEIIRRRDCVASSHHSSPLPPVLPEPPVLPVPPVLPAPLLFPRNSPFIQHHANKIAALFPANAVFPSIASNPNVIRAKEDLDLGKINFGAYLKVCAEAMVPSFPCALAPVSVVLAQDGVGLQDVVGSQEVEEGGGGGGSQDSADEPNRLGDAAVEAFRVWREANDEYKKKSRRMAVLRAGKERLERLEAADAANLTARVDLQKELREMCAEVAAEALVEADKVAHAAVFVDVANDAAVKAAGFSTGWSEDEQSQSQ